MEACWLEEICFDVFRKALGSGFSKEGHFLLGYVVFLYLFVCLIQIRSAGLEENIELYAFEKGHKM